MGGVEFSTLYLARDLDRDCFDPSVVCPKNGKLTKLCHIAGIRTIIVPQVNFCSTSWCLGRHKIFNPFAVIWNVAGMFLGALRLAICFQREKPDLVCSKGLLMHFCGGLAALLTGLPCVWHLQDTIASGPFKIYRILLGWGAKLLAKHIVIDGTPILETLPRSLQKTGKISLVFNGVDIDAFSAVAQNRSARQEFNVGANEIIIGNIARFAPWKGQDVLIRAFAELTKEFPSIRLLLVGVALFEGDRYEKFLLKLIRDLGVGDKVVFSGYRWDLPEILSAIDLFVYPAIEKDTSPLALISAMAAGKPMICSDIPGLRELFPKCMQEFLVPPSDCCALSAGIRRLLLNRRLGEHLAELIHKHARDTFSLRVFTEQCSAVFAKISKKYEN